MRRWLVSLRYFLSGDRGGAAHGNALGTLLICGHLRHLRIPTES